MGRPFCEVNMLWWLLGLVAIAIWTIWPIIPLLFIEWFIGPLDYVNSSDSQWAVLPWLLFFTLPSGFVLLLLWCGVGIYWWAT